MYAAASKCLKQKVFSLPVKVHIGPGGDGHHGFAGYAALLRVLHHAWKFSNSSNKRIVSPERCTSNSIRCPLSY
jgi:hypothetical protein